MRRKRKYIAKPRFFIIIAVLLCALAGALFYFTGESKDGAENAAAYAIQREQGFRIAMSARAYISNKDLRYDDQYYAGGYPPEEIGVCTDVVWKGLNGIGITLKDLVDEDIADNFNAYDDIISVADPNIDFRLVPQLERFLARNTEVLSNDVDNILVWQEGDIVTFESSHVAVVSSFRNIWGRPYIIQHGKDPAAEEDRIFASDGMEISGHFRWPALGPDL